MNKQKSELNKVLSVLIESWNPEIEKYFQDYVKSTSMEHKTVQLCVDGTWFIQVIEKIISDDVSSEEEKNRLILSGLTRRLLHDLALYYEYRRCDEM